MLVKFLPLANYILFCASIGLISIVLILFNTNYIMILAVTAIMAFGIAGLYPSILSYGTLQVENPSSQLVTFFISAGIIGAVAGLILTSYLKQSFGALASIGSGAVAAGFIIFFIVMTMVGRRNPPGRIADETLVPIPKNSV